MTFDSKRGDRATTKTEELCTLSRVELLMTVKPKRSD